MKKQINLKKKVVLGVTGSFGSGKSTVAGMFKSYKAKVIDADALAHQCISLQSAAHKKIVVIFGEGILSKDKVIQRKKLAGIVFNNRYLLKKLNRIIHPEVIRLIKKEINSTSRAVVVLDVPLLIESGLESLVDKLIVVNIGAKEQVKRIQAKMIISKADILKRIACQIPLREKLRKADFIIDNSGTRQETKKQVERVMKQLSLAALTKL